MRAKFDVKEFSDSRSYISNWVLNSFEAAVGEINEKMVEWVHEQMETGYSKPPIDSGDTYRSIQSEASTTGSNTFSVTVSAGTDYAVYVHNGTYKMAARPFIRDGMEGHITDMSLIIGSRLSEL